MIVIKDKKDMETAPDTFLKNIPYKLMGKYDGLNFVDKDVRVLSVQFSKVGAKTYSAFPNLEWIIARSHGTDNINLDECDKRGIGVISTKPYAKSTARWIKQFLQLEDIIGFIGHGAIASNINVFNNIIYNTQSSRDELITLAKNVDTLVITIPQTPETKHIIGEDVLSVFSGKIISVGRWDIIDNEALLKYIDRINYAVIDTLGKTKQQELLATGKILYTKHTAWEYKFAYDEKYFQQLETFINDCLNNNVKNPDLMRRRVVTLWD